MAARHSRRTACVVRDGQGRVFQSHDDSFAALCSHLIASGYDVTVLHVAGQNSTECDAWRQWCGEGGLNFELACVDTLPEIAGGRAVLRSLAAYNWLKERRFDVVYFVDRGGLGYYALLARGQGLCLQDSSVVVWLDEPTLFRYESGDSAHSLLEVLEQDHMERECVARADALWTRHPSGLKWMRQRRWRLPRTHILRPAVSAEESSPAWPAGRTLYHRPSSRKSGDRHPRSAVTPLVSVCLTHHERPYLLAQALASLREQTYPRFEVIVVDDGSRSDEARQYLRSLEPEFRERRWRIVRQRNRYLGAARNRAVREARGRYLLFMDDDNVAKPEAIEVFVRAAASSGADVLTCFLDVFRGQQAPGRDTRPVHRLPFLGGALTVGMIRNCLGDANCLIRRRVFDAIGGFTEDRHVCGEDWELLAKAALAGYRVEVVPEALAWYRQSTTGMLNTTPDLANRQRALRPYLEALPSGLESVLAMAAAHASRAPSHGDRVVFRAHESIRRVAIVGCGRGIGQAIALATRCGWEVAHLLDNNPELWGSAIDGRVVESPAALAPGDVDLFIVTSSSGRVSIERQLKAIGLNEPVVFYRDPVAIRGVEVCVNAG